MSPKEEFVTVYLIYESMRERSYFKMHHLFLIEKLFDSYTDDQCTKQMINILKEIVK